MIEFIRRNKIISLFGLISILISASYAATYNMPDYFGIESWYSLLNNISISYIAALIFYILQVYKPDRENNKRAHTILSPQFSELVRFLEIVIACCRKFVTIDENGTLTIQWSDAEKKVIYFVPFKEGKDEHRPAIRQSKSDISQLENTYKAKIKEMKERIDFRACDPAILNVVSRLETDDFFKSTIHTAAILEESFVKFENFQNSVNRFEALKEEFKECCGITDNYSVRDAEAMEIAACDVIMDQGALQAASAEAFGKKVFREYVKGQLKEKIKDEALLEQIKDEALLDRIIDQSYADLQRKSLESERKNESQ